MYEEYCEAYSSELIFAYSGTEHHYIIVIHFDIIAHFSLKMRSIINTFLIV